MIIINDCSNDDSIALIKPLISGHPNIKLIELKENCGLSNARNLGIDNSKGKYVWFVDSDDKIDPSATSTLLSILNSKTEIIHINHKRTDKKIAEKFSYKMLPGSPGSSFLYDNFPPSPVQFYIWSLDFLRSNNLRFYPGIYHEDALFTASALSLANQVQLCETALYSYTIRQNSITSSSNFYERAESMVIILEKFIELTKNASFNSKQELALTKQVGINIGAVFYYWKLLSKSDRTKIEMKLRLLTINYKNVKIKYIIYLILMRLKA